MLNAVALHVNNVQLLVLKQLRDLGCIEQDTSEVPHNPAVAVLVAGGPQQGSAGALFCLLR